MRNLRVWIIACSCFVTLPCEALAQQSPTTPDVVIITAQKRAEDIQDVPIAVTALSGFHAAGIYVNNDWGRDRRLASTHASATDLG